MASAKEKLEALLLGIRQRQELEARVETAWKKALPRCLGIARNLAQVLHNHGLRVDAEVLDDSLIVQFADQISGDVKWWGASAVFRLDANKRSVEGVRFGRRPKDSLHAAGEPYFSLSVKPPPAQPLTAEFGPQAPFAFVDSGPDTQQAFEKAVVDFFEWALLRDCASNPMRLP